MTPESKLKFIESAISNANVILWSADAQGNYTSCEGNGLRALNLKDNEFVGQNIFEVHKDEPLSIESVQRALAGESFSRELEVLGRYYYSYYAPLRSEAGEIIGMSGLSIDVTDKVLRERELALERKNLEDIFNFSPNFAAIASGPDFVFENANSRYYQLIGHREIIGKPVLKALPELRGQGFEELLKKVYESGETVVGEETPVTVQPLESGPTQTRYVDFMYQRIDNLDGTPKGIYAHGVDVTEKVLARKKIEESARMFRTFADSMPHMAFVANPQGDVTFFNRKWYEYIGAVEGTEGWGWKDKQIHHPDDLQTTIERWTHSLRTGEPYEIKYRLRRHDGEYRWHLGKANPVYDDKGEIEWWVGTNTDIHDNKLLLDRLAESEAKFKTIADAMPQMVWSSLPDGYHDYFNDRWYEFTGLPYGSTDGEAWTDLFHPEDQKRTVEIWHECLRSGKPYMVEYRLRHHNGEYRWALGRALPVRNKKGEITRWMGTCTDIHEMKTIQDELRKSLKARDEFLSIASHELKTPLTTLKLQTQSMRRNYEKGRLEAFSLTRVSALIKTNEKQISRLVRLVDDMLDFSRIESGKLSFHFEQEDLGTIVKDICERLREQVEFAGSDFTMQVAEGCLVRADLSRLEQVITNLLTNAIRYGEGKPISVTLEKKDDVALLRVRDEGIGIAPENREKIFQRFERLVDANTISGLGLGLYITKEIIESHGGRIWVEGQLHEGSVFNVELKLDKV